MSAVDDFKFTRDDLLDVLNEMSVAIPRDTKVKPERLQHRLERTLNAAQRYSALFGNELTHVNPSDYPSWDEKKDITEGLYRRCWGGIQRDGERPRGAFARMCASIISFGESIKRGTRYVVFSNDSLTGIVVRVLAIHAVKEKRPLILLSYSALASTKEMSIKTFLSKEQASDIRIIHIGRVEQALLLRLLIQNRKHLSPDFTPPAGLKERSHVSFLLPVAWLGMLDIGRLNKTSGCVICGEPTRSRCAGCNSTQYCSKDCQLKHWPEHKVLCRTISSGTWHTIVLEPNPMAFMMGGMSRVWINRYDDLNEDTLVSDEPELDAVPPNIYGDNYHLVKLQLPVASSVPSHILIYDRSKSFSLFYHAEKNLDVFIKAVEAMGDWPKIYRWAQRVGDWEWKICFDRKPEPTPLW